jgi:hypothetical protein
MKTLSATALPTVGERPDGEPSRFHPEGFADAEVRRVRDIIASRPVIRLDRPALIRY